RLAASLGGASIRQFDVATGKEIPLVGAGHSRAVAQLRLSPDGKTLTTCAPGDSVRVWDLTTGNEIRHLKLSSHSTCAALSSDGQWVVSATGDVVEIRNVATGKRQQMTAGEVPVAAVALAPDKKTLATRSVNSGEIRLWEVATGKERRGLTDDAA